MPDIAKINAVAIADIEKVDGILAANIEKVNGLTVPSAVPVGTPAAAYSVRLLDTALGVPTYTGAAMRVRRETAGGTGDDDEADIAFDSGIISLDSAISNASAGVTATTLGQFINVGTVNGTTYTNPDSLTVTASCLVDTWMDQSSNGNDAEQATHSSQPQIHDGTVDTDLITENGKPSLDFDGGDLLRTSQLTTVAQPTTRIAVSHFDTVTTTNKGYIQDGHTLRQAVGTRPFNSWNWRMFSGTASDYTDIPNINTQYLSFAVFDNASSNLNLNGTNLGNKSVGTQGFDGLTIGASAGSSTVFLDGGIQEVIVYADDETSNRTDIEDNINAEFGIY